MRLHSEEKKVPIRLSCKRKNRERLESIIGKIIYQFEIDGKREDDFIAKKIEIVNVEHPYFVFLEQSNRNGEPFKSLLDCLRTDDSETLKKHFGR